MIFGFFQIANHQFGLEYEPRIILLNVLFYSVMLVTSVFHPFIMRRFSLKFALIAGLVSDLLAVCLLWISEEAGGLFILVTCAFVLAAISIVSVINCIVTYLVIEFPKSLSLAMIALFLFANMGILASTLIYNFLMDHSFYPIFCGVAVSLLLLAIYFVYAKFFNPIVPAHLAHMRRSSLIWKEFHYRIGLFLLMMLFYGIVETLLSVWGGVYLLKFVTESQAQQAIVLFWVCMVLGQIVLLAPMYFFSARKIFSLLILFTIGVIFFLETRTHATGLMAGYIGAGLGCAIIFPSLLAFLEKEVLVTCSVSKIQSPIAFVETGISLMVGSYLAGVGIVSIFVLKNERYLEMFTHNTFHWVALMLAVIGIAATYLNWSSATTHHEP
jgi:hypothetical protein